MSWLFEDPLPVIIVGGLLELMLAATLYTTRRGNLLFAMAGVLVVVLGVVALERIVVTEREQVENTLLSAANALVAGDLDRVYEYVAPEAQYTRSRVEWVLQTVELRAITLRDLQIEINELTSPPTARATFVAFFRYRDKSNTFPYESYQLRLSIELEKGSDRWLITDHVEYEPLR